MNTNPKLGNRVIALSVAIASAIASLFVQWGTLKLTEDDVRQSMTINGQSVVTNEMGDMFAGMMSSVMTGVAIPLSGQSGSVTLGSINIPFWFAIAAVVFGLVVTITNSIGVSDVPRAIILGLLVLGVVISLWAVVVMVRHGSIGLGALLLFGSSAAGLLELKNQRQRVGFVQT